MPVLPRNCLELVNEFFLYRGGIGSLTNKTRDISDSQGNFWLVDFFIGAFAVLLFHISLASLSNLAPRTQSSQLDFLTSTRTPQVYNFIRNAQDLSDGFTLYLHVRAYLASPYS